MKCEKEGEIGAEYQNRPKGCIPPISSAEISYDEGSVKITAHNGEEGNTDNHKVLHINIMTIGGIDKDKHWEIIELRKMYNNQIYIQLRRD